MPILTPEGQHLVDAMANRHGFGRDAVTQLLQAVAAGGGWQAQFNHPELGGMGQWSSGGMIMIGDMFNNALKYRVDALCNDLAGALRTVSPFAQSQHGGGRWPAELGTPSSTGSQNDMAYAVFPATRRLAVDQAGHITIYDTGDHQIGGVSQQQGGDQSLTFTSQYGLVRLHDLPLVSPSGETQPAVQTAAASPPAPVNVDAPATNTTASLDDDVLFARLERLAELAQKGGITQEEFAAKKAELLARL